MLEHALKRRAVQRCTQVEGQPKKWQHLIHRLWETPHKLTIDNPLSRSPNPFSNYSFLPILIRPNLRLVELLAFDAHDRICVCMFKFTIGRFYCCYFGNYAFLKRTSFVLFVRNCWCVAYGLHYAVAYIANHRFHASSNFVVKRLTELIGIIPYWQGSLDLHESQYDVVSYFSWNSEIIRKRFKKLTFNSLRINVYQFSSVFTPNVT